MKDCSNCPDKPEAGAAWELTPCARCKPWEPPNDKRMVSMPTDMIDRIFYTEDDHG